MTEELKQKAEEYVESKGKEHFRKFYDKQLSMADLLKICCIEFAIEVTKELQEQIEYLNNLVNEKEQRGFEIQEDLLKEKIGLEKQNKKAKEIIRKLLQDIEIAENEYKFTSQTAIRAERFLKE